jgi:hypothetical protein
MKELFIPYNLALALKELGFNERCFGYYDFEKDLILFGDKLQNPSCNSDLSNVHPDYYNNEISAPLYQQVFKWFREKHRLDGHVTFRESKTNKIEGINSVYYDIEIYTLMGGDAIKSYKHKEISNDKEEAELTCLIKLIEIVKSK